MQKRYTDGEKYFEAALARASDPTLAARIHFGLGFCLYQHGGGETSHPRIRFRDCTRRDGA